jgi:hypothetical protein
MTEEASGLLVAGGSLVNRGQTEIKFQQAVPEPGTLGMLGTMLASLGFVAWRRRRSG